MKHRLGYTVAGLLAGATLLISPVAFAMASNGQVLSDSTANTSDSEKTSSHSDDTSRIESDNHTSAERIAKFKTKFKIELAQAEKDKLKLHCVAAQGVVSKLHTRFGNSVTTRTKAYIELQARLTKLITNLKAKNVDTTTLEQEQTVLNGKIATYNTDLTAYKQSLTDLKAVDCKTDPAGFKAALEAARSAHDTVVADALAVRTYLVGTIKPTLQAILKTLETSTTN